MCPAGPGRSCLSWLLLRVSGLRHCSWALHVIVCVWKNTTLCPSSEEQQQSVRDPLLGRVRAGAEPSALSGRSVVPTCAHLFLFNCRCPLPGLLPPWAAAAASHGQRYCPVHGQEPGPSLARAGAGALPAAVSICRLSWMYPHTQAGDCDSGRSSPER